MTNEEIAKALDLTTYTTPDGPDVPDPKKAAYFLCELAARIAGGMLADLNFDEGPRTVAERSVFVAREIIAEVIRDGAKS